MDGLIEINQVSKSFGRKQVLNKVSCHLENGIYGLLGPNGAGKTTLMRCMADLYKVSGGSVLLDGVPLGRKKKHVGYLPQSFGLFKELTVQDCLDYFCGVKDIPRPERKEWIEKTLAAVNLTDSAGTKTGKLSGGMMRRVGVAQALLGRPELIMFDEPTAGLDPEERMNFKRILSGLGERETVVISTHIVEDIEAFCDHVIVMSRGEILYTGTCEEMKQLAEGKVYACEKDNASAIPSNAILEKQYEQSGTVYYRILSGTKLALPALEPSVEDGYMCIIKNIGRRVDV